ncbi:ECF-type sigma factor [Bythopirellula goksoeyrii]|uniref:ECF sigma factor n=1 Tax=Bythopirellula goksoeyrii TaxID=1400387 RepID=A0A5B9QHG0_9BACT|nr:ECF-type sigma factor [Bythopirellula goksoeyrii]QEG37020.1 ECF sigma factor [Bythopirellula goksoeyrii]
MTDASRILADACSGTSGAAEKLLPLVYEELRKLAAAKLAHEKPGQTLEATALVHEAYLRLIGSNPDEPQEWDGRGHFFSAAAESMRRILVEKARRKGRFRHGGDRKKVELDDSHGGNIALISNDDVLAIHEALGDLELVDGQAAEVVKLRYFLGLSFAETAEMMDISERTAYRNWAYARAWLFDHLDP